MLARAVKEHERRKGAREGFSDSPADCLAYKHYRDVRPRARRRRRAAAHAAERRRRPSGA